VSDDAFEIDKLIEEGREEAIRGPINDDELWQEVSNLTVFAQFPDANDIAAEALSR
jgi:hypothetical protein